MGLRRQISIWSGLRFRGKGRSVVAPHAIFRRGEPRTLAHAIRLYLHQEANATHSAPADAIAAPRVLDSQVQTNALPADPSPMLVRVGIRGRFPRGAEGVIPFSFGKHRGRPLTTNAVADESYLRRMRSGVNLPDGARELTHRAIANRLPVR